MAGKYVGMGSPIATAASQLGRKRFHQSIAVHTNTVLRKSPRTGCHRTNSFSRRQRVVVVISKTSDFLALTKPRLVLMVLVTTLAGYYLGSLGEFDWIRLLNTLVGTALAAGGTIALNQYIERDLDAKMKRTRLRPLPDGRLRPDGALVFGLVISVGGALYLLFTVNALSSLLAALTVSSYIFLYTPLKRKTSFCTVAGAVPGALPPVGGWVAAQSTLSLEAWVLFAIMFFWQVPHSLAIAWLYRTDYERADLKLLPVIHPDGRSTAPGCV